MLDRRFPRKEGLLRVNYTVHKVQYYSVLLRVFCRFLPSLYRGVYFKLYSNHPFEELIPQIESKGNRTQAIAPL